MRMEDGLTIGFMGRSLLEKTMQSRDGNGRLAAWLCRATSIRVLLRVLSVCVGCCFCSSSSQGLVLVWVLLLLW